MWLLTCARRKLVHADEGGCQAAAPRNQQALQARQAAPAALHLQLPHGLPAPPLRTLPLSDLLSFLDNNKEKLQSLWLHNAMRLDLAPAHYLLPRMIRCQQGALYHSSHGVKQCT